MHTLLYALGGVLALALTLRWRREPTLRLRAMAGVVRSRGRDHENHGPISDRGVAARLRRWFYTAKALLCLLLGRSRPFDWSDAFVDRMAMWDYWEYNGYPEPNNGWWELAVGYGLLRRWCYAIYRNSNY